MTKDDLVKYLKRSDATVKHIAASLVGSRLSYLYPEVIHHPNQALILVDSLPLSGGTKLTEKTAVAMKRSHKTIAMSAANAKDEALKWLRQFLGMSSALVLNVAGPRESKAPGIQARVKAFLEELLWECEGSMV